MESLNYEKLHAYLRFPSSVALTFVCCWSSVYVPPGYIALCDAEILVLPVFCFRFDAGVSIPTREFPKIGDPNIVP